MRIEKIATEYETRYISDDGKEWKAKWLCQQYEELLKDPTPLKTLKFFDSEGEPIDVFALKEIPCFSYLVITEDIANYDSSVVKAIIGSQEYSETSYNLPTFKGVYYNDWSEAFNGGYGRNGWVEEDSIEWLERRIKSCQNKINILKKITKPLDK